MKLVKFEIDLRPLEWDLVPIIDRCGQSESLNNYLFVKFLIFAVEIEWFN